MRQLNGSAPEALSSVLIVNSTVDRPIATTDIQDPHCPVFKAFDQLGAHLLDDLKGLTTRNIVISGVLDPQPRPETQNEICETLVS